jgi:hypothetical protein
MNNGVNFGGNWNWFDLMNIPIVAYQWGPISQQFWSSPINGGNVDYAIVGEWGWNPVQIGTGFDLFGWNASAWATFFKTASNPIPAFKQGSCFQQFLEGAFDPAAEIAGQVDERRGDISTVVPNRRGFGKGKAPSKNESGRGFDET